jgi:hypothetical protein
VFCGGSSNVDRLPWLPFEDKQALEDIASYMVRNVLSLKRPICLEGRDVLRHPGQPFQRVHGLEVTPEPWVHLG